MPDERTQFRVLYRQFLASLIDLELLSAKGDVTKLLGQFAALLASFSAVLAFGGLMVDTRRWAPDVAETALWNMEHFMISTTMLVVGVFAVLSWDSTFPDKRDVLVLGPLPVRARTLFLAKAASLGAALGLIVASLNIFSGFIWPLHFAGDGFLGVPRAVAALWIALAASGAFVFCLVLAVQGIASQILPRRVFLRVSAVLQIAAFCLFVGVYFLEPSVSPSGMADPRNQQQLAWFPAYWFLAMFEWLNGGAHFELARRAWMITAGLVLITIAVYVLSYVRTLRRIVEQPDLSPAVRAFRWLPRFGTSLDTAVVRFSIRTIARSRQHRMVLAFYLGIGFAVLILFLHAPERQRTMPDAGMLLLFANFVVMIVTVVGVRAVFAMPMALKANWIFRVAESAPTREYLAAIRRPLFVLGVAPVWIASACVYFVLWPFERAAGHLTILGLCGAIVAYACLNGFRKIPFTCSFLPGKSGIHMVILASIGMVLVIGQAVRIEAGLLDHPRSFAAAAGMLLIVALALRSWITRDEESGVQFEESEPPAVLTLGLDASP